MLYAYDKVLTNKSFKGQLSLDLVWKQIKSNNNLGIQHFEADFP